MFVDQSAMPGNLLATSLATSSIMPEVSRTTLGFSQMVTPLKPRFFAYSKAAVTMRVAALRVMMRQLTASAGPGTLANALNLGWLFRAARTFSGGFVHSTPAY